MSDFKQKKILMVSYSFPPAGGSAVQRPLKFAKLLPVYGWKPYVVTIGRKSEPLDHSLVKEVPEGISVNGVFSLDPISLDLILQESLERKNIGKISRGFLKMILKIYSVIYYRIVIVDWYDGWIPFGFKKGIEIINKENTDLIYVHGQPFSSFVIGFLLKKFTGKPLVIDYDDSWTTSVYAKNAKGVKQRIRRSLEHKILEIADRVISVKKETIRGIRENFPGISENKFDLIPNGYDPEDFLNLEKKKRSKLVITYTGRLSERFCYSPESFLHALGQLIGEKKILKGEIQVIFAGTVSLDYQIRLRDLVRKLDLERVINFTGFVSHKECIKYLMDSDILLLIIESHKGKKFSYEFSGSVPAKIFEYIYTGVPILAITPPGFEADLIEKTGTGFVVEPNNVSAVKDLLYRLYQRHNEGMLRIEPDRGEISKYDRKTLTEKLSGVLDRVLSGK